MEGMGWSVLSVLAGDVTCVGAMVRGQVEGQTTNFVVPRHEQRGSRTQLLHWPSPVHSQPVPLLAGPGPPPQ
jgi:hypothetical protein